MATTERRYASLAPGVLREAPEVLERFIVKNNAPPARLTAFARALAEAPVLGSA